MDLNRFISSINSYGLMRNNRFRILFSPPPVLIGFVQDREILTLYAESSVIPGIQLSVTDYRRYGIGPLEKKPSTAVYTDWNCSFLGDGKGEILRFFHQWMKFIVNSNFRQEGTANGLGEYEIEYKQEFQTQLDIRMLTEQDDEVMKIVLYDAYPIYVPDISINRGDINSIMRIPITFTYKEFENEAPDQRVLTQSLSTSIEFPNA